MAVVWGLFLPVLAGAQEGAATTGSEPGKSAVIHPVRRSLFKVEVSLEGVFESAEMTPVVLRPETWSDWVVREAAAPGTSVKAGDVVLALEDQKIKEAIAELETSQRLAELALRVQEAELAVLEKKTPLDLEIARRANKTAADDLDYFLKIDRDVQTRSADFNLKMVGEYLEYEQEELKQLERMYKADDLTEETEEIVLKRQRDAVERAKFNLEVSKIASEHTIGVKLPREEARLHEGASTAALLLEKAELDAPAALDRARIALEKSRYEFAKNGEKLEKLKRDANLMLLRSPKEGVVYYGNCVRGQWTTGATIASKLERGGTLQSHEVLMTVVAPRPVFVRASTPEKHLHQLLAGQKGEAVPAAFPDAPLVATIEEVAGFPDAAGKFSARLKLDLADQEPAVVPGMNCTVKIIVYRKDDALTVPAKAVFSDDADSRKKFVFKTGPIRHDVQVGRRTDEKVEIISGLAEGDQILLERPEGM